MRKKPLLAIAALTALAAGCTAIPSVPGTDSALRAPAASAPDVTLRTQGLLKAALASAKVETSLVGMWIPGQAIAGSLGHLVAVDAIPPEGATNATYLKFEEGNDTTPSQYAVLGSVEGATHRFYQFDAFQQADFQALTPMLRHTTSGATSSVTTLVTESGNLKFPFPTPTETYKVEVTAEADSTLHFVDKMSGAPGYYRLSKTLVSVMPYYRDFRLTADVTLKDAKGEPLTGLKRENFLIGVTLTINNGTFDSSQFDTTLDVTEPQAGTYRVVSTITGVPDVKPSAYALDLGIQNAPLIHDAGY